MVVYGLRISLRRRLNTLDAPRQSINHVRGLGMFCHRWISFLGCRTAPVTCKRYYVMTSGLIEEQTLPRYSQRRYYPVRIGQRLVDRYKIVAKLGFGAYSTVWLARDERTNTYASIKVFVQDKNPTLSPVMDEIRTLQHMKSCPQEHSGSAIARLPRDIFQLDGPTGQHQCLAFKPQGCSLWTLRHMFPNGQLSSLLAPTAVRCLLGCINWLYLDCDLIHTEITTQNVLTQVASDDLFVAVEREEQNNPSKPIIDNGYPIYPSRGEPRTILDLTGVAYLTDFGSARSASIEHQDWWMPDTYRAPEILMGVPWGCQVDIWSVGIMALELVEGRNLFEPIDRTHNQYVLPLALAQYISVLGLPPLWMIRESKSPYIPTFFDDQGRWISEVPIPRFSLEDWVTAIPKGAEKDKFISFIRRILVWDAMERATSSDLLSDPWQIPEGGE